jgi:hypothetical protein
MREREAQTRAQRRARAEQEHTSWKEQLVTLKKEALEHLWQWPDGMCVSLYHVTYCACIGRGEDDEPILEREGGWTRTDHLDEHGYLGLEPTKPSSWSKTTEPQTIKLSRPSTCRFGSGGPSAALRSSPANYARRSSSAFPACSLVAVRTLLPASVSPGMRGPTAKMTTGVHWARSPRLDTHAR